MNIHTIWGQRACRYPGEYAPELLEAHDQNGVDENPDFLDQKFEEYEASKEFSRVQRVTLNIPRGQWDTLVNRMTCDLSLSACVVEEPS